MYGSAFVAVLMMKMRMGLQHFEIMRWRIYSLTHALSIVHGRRFYCDWHCGSLKRLLSPIDLRYGLDDGRNQQMWCVRGHSHGHNHGLGWEYVGYMQDQTEESVRTEHGNSSLRRLLSIAKVETRIEHDQQKDSLYPIACTQTRQSGLQADDL